jgi:hypothetical protein
MLLTAFFTNNGSPATGLSPTISVWNAVTTANVVNAQAMTEIASGFYKYDFTSYDRLLNYVILTDGGGTLDNSERYGYGVNESYQEDIAAETWATTVSGYETTTYGEAVALIRQVEIGKWQISGSYLYFYDTDGTTAIATFLLDDPDAPTLRTPQ